MSYVVYDHLIRNTSQELKYNNVNELLYARITRSYFVGNINDATNGNEVVAKAVSYIKASVVAPNTAHPDVAAATARGYEGFPVNAHDAAEVVVTFEYTAGGYSPTTYVVEVSHSLTGHQTNAYYDGSNVLKPAFVPYNIDWAQPATNGPITSSWTERPVMLNVLRPVCTYTISKSITATKVASLQAAIRDYIGRTNADVFLGQPIASMLCMGMDTRSVPYQADYLAKLVWSQRPSIITDGDNWQEYGRVRETEHGVPTNIWVQGPDYINNGIDLFKVYRTATMATLVAIL